MKFCAYVFSKFFFLILFFTVNSRQLVALEQLWTWKIQVNAFEATRRECQNLKDS